MAQRKEILVFLALIGIGMAFSGWLAAVGVLCGWTAYIINRRLLLRCCQTGSLAGLPQRLRINAAVRLFSIIAILTAAARIGIRPLLWGTLGIATGQCLWMRMLWRSRASRSWEMDLPGNGYLYLPDGKGGFEDEGN